MSHYQQCDAFLTESRLKRFQAFYDSLDEAERAALDAKLNRWQALMRDRGAKFGPAQAQELFVALAEGARA